MNSPTPQKLGWIAKFRVAGRGVAIALREGSSYLVHVPMALGVVAIATWLKVDAVRWALLVLAIGMALAAEMFNSALERMAKAITTTENSHIRDALDQASGAVLVVAVAAAITGLLVFVPQWNLWR